ncbi:MAG: sugar phosphate isomerase/epimerase [Pseudoxanthomonas sp.]
MTITLPRRVATAALLLCATLPAFAKETSAAKLPIAVQMYTLRNIPSLEDRLKLVHDAGITAVETVGTQDVTAPELKRLLDQYGIQAVSTHAPLADLRKDPDAVVAFNKAIGNHVLVVPYLQEEERPKDAAGWTALGRELGQIANKVKAQGMTLAYHNHDFEFAKFGDKTGLELMFEGAGSALKSELDLAWVARAGYDPAAFLGKLKGRVIAVHAKDNAPKGQAAEEHGFAALGTGVLDWNKILPAADRAGVKWYIIEHDYPLDPAVVVKTGAKFLVEHLPADVKR